MKIVVLGGVAVGATFVTRMRRLSEEHEIVIYEKSSFISYANCGLPYNLSGKIKREKLEITTPNDLETKFNVRVNVNSEAIAINPQTKKVTIKNLKKHTTSEVSYDKLILGTGTSAIILPIPGLNKEENVFTLKNLDDLDKINKFIKDKKPKKTVIFGGGFIGLEVAESLIEAGWEVAVLDIVDSLVKMDKDMSVLVENELTSNGVNLYLKAKTKLVDHIKKEVVLEDGRKIKYDVIFATAGIKPNTDFVKKAGIKVDDRGIVLTNEFMLTSDENIYAAGDIVYSLHKITGKKVYSPLAWGANRQAKVMANHINGIKDKQPATLNTAIIKVFRKSVAQTGLNEFGAKMEKLDYDIAIADLNHHAGYYPGAKKVTVKLVFEKKTNRVLGAQAVGEGADKKIDVIAAAIYSGQTIFDLLDLNLAYSPPYGSAKDVINIVAAVATNKVQRKIKAVQGFNLKANAFIIDVRPKTIFEIGSMPNAINIPGDELRTTTKLPSDKNKEIFVTCNTGHQSYNALSILRGLGYTNIINVEGGFQHYAAYQKALSYQPKENQHQKVAPVKMKTPEKVIVSKTIGKTYDLDCTGLACPGPLLKLYEKLAVVKDGDQLNITASDFGFAEDLKTWVKKNNHTLVSVESTDDSVNAVVIKGLVGSVTPDSQALAKIITQGKKRATIVLFSGEYDKAIAAFIIAQAAASLGTKVTIFATFWGLNALRVKTRIKFNKTFTNKVFASVMPLGADKMKLSSLNMMGFGKKILKSTMTKNNIKGPGEMLADSMKMGISIIACTMSMGLLGIEKEEIIKGCTFAGAAKYVSHADDANLTLFI